jgi:hypothetical protein
MLGDGEKTLGARWNNGKVQEFESYKFVSKSYHSMKYYIKSIDPWLMGYCRSEILYSNRINLFFIVCVENFSK